MDLAALLAELPNPQALRELKFSANKVEAKRITYLTEILAKFSNIEVFSFSVEETATYTDTEVQKLFSSFYHWTKL